MSSISETSANEINENIGISSTKADEECPTITPDSPIATSSKNGEVNNLGVNGLVLNSNEDLVFSDAKECIVEVPVPEYHPADLIRKIDSCCGVPTLPQIPEVSNPTSSSSDDSSCSRREFGFCSCCTAYCCYNYNRCIRTTFNSPFALPLYLMSMAFPIAAGYMGARYMQECPAGASTPLFLFLIGLCGVLCVASRMVDVLQHWMFPHSQIWDFPSYTCFFSLMTILLLLITEMMVMLRIDPNFEDTKSDDFCHPVFYNFTYYGNFVGFILVISSCIIYLPRILCSPQSNMYPNPYQGL